MKIWPQDPFPPPTDILKLTPVQENKLGKAILELIASKNSIRDRSSAPSKCARLAASADTVVKRFSHPDMELKFFVFDSDEAFTFSHPGGYIYASQGLFPLIVEDAELEFLLRMRSRISSGSPPPRPLRRSGIPRRFRRNIPGLSRPIYHQIAIGYDRKEEFEADREACRVLAELRRSPYQISLFINRLNHYEGLHAAHGENLKAEPKATEEIQDVTKHWWKHPERRGSAQANRRDTVSACVQAAEVLRLSQAPAAQTTRNARLSPASAVAAAAGPMRSV